MKIFRNKLIVKEFVWLLCGQLVSLAASIILISFLTEKLDPEDYGLLALSLTLGTLIGQVAFSSSMPGIQRYYSIAVEKNNANQYLIESYRLIWFGTLVAVVLGALLLAGLPLFGKEGMAAITSAAIFYTVLSNYNVTLSMIQNAARQRKVVVLHNSVDALLKIIICALLISWFGGLAIYVIVAYIISLSFVLVSQIIYIRRLIPKEIAASEKTGYWSDKIWQYSKPFLYFNTFTWVQSSSDRWALETFATTYDVGLYAVLIQLGLTPMGMVAGLVITLVGPILFQKSGDAKDSSRNARVSKHTWSLTLLAIAVMFVAFIIAWFTHDHIFRILVADQYWSVSYLLPWMIMAGGVVSAGQVISLKILSDLNTSILILPKIISSVVGTLLSFSGAYLFGLPGVVFAAVVFSWLNFVWLCVLAMNGAK